MSDPLFTEVVNYSDREFNRVHVTLRGGENGIEGWTSVAIEFNAQERGTYRCRLKFLELTHVSENGRVAALKRAAISLAKWMVLNGSYAIYPFAAGGEVKDVILSRHAAGEADYQYRDPGDSVLIDHPPLAALPIMESRLARQLIIRHLYDRSHQFDQLVIEQIDFPEEVVERELQGLVLSPYVVQTGSEVRLTTAGREYYESRFGSTIGTVFIIAACAPPADEAGLKGQHEIVLSTYKKAIDDAGYRPIFQEHEEPHKNIYIDVFDYLDTCEFVVADITWERPNCYIEIGYALAAKKRVLLFVEESYLREMEKQQMPFDIAPVKWLTYSRGDEGLNELRRLIDQRIDILKTRRLAAI